MSIADFYIAHASFLQGFAVCYAFGGVAFGMGARRAPASTWGVGDNDGWLIVAGSFTLACILWPIWLYMFARDQI